MREGERKGTLKQIVVMRINAMPCHREERNLPLKTSHFDTSIAIFLYFIQNIPRTEAVSGGWANNFTRR